MAKLGGRSRASSKSKILVDGDAIARIVASETPTFEDIKRLMRGVRYSDGYDETFEYADSLLPEASDYLRPYSLRALVRADITEKEAASNLAKNKAFFRRLVKLLPSIISYFSDEELRRNPSGIIYNIDICHNEFEATGNAARRDRQLREAKEKLTRAERLTREAAAAMSDAEEHCKYEFDRYRAVYYRPAPGPARFLSDLIDELKMSAGVFEIMREIADIAPMRAFVFGSDQRSDFVQSVYHMCTMWGGPKLVTTPGSDFAVLCGLLFEAVSGKADEGLAGAINRYARSPERKQWDAEDGDDPNDNFQSAKSEMVSCWNAIELCKKVYERPDLSDMALLLLNARMKHEELQYEVARSKHGPHQVTVDQLNEDQLQNILMDAIGRLKPEQFDDLKSGKSMARLDIEYGLRIRAFQAVDAKSGKSGN